VVEFFKKKVESKLKKKKFRLLHVMTELGKKLKVARNKSFFLAREYLFLSDPGKWLTSPLLLSLRYHTC